MDTCLSRIASQIKTRQSVSSDDLPSRDDAIEEVLHRGKSHRNCNKPSGPPLRRRKRKPSHVFPFINDGGQDCPLHIYSCLPPEECLPDQPCLEEGGNRHKHDEETEGEEDDNPQIPLLGRPGSEPATPCPLAMQVSGTPCCHVTSDPVSLLMDKPQSSKQDSRKQRRKSHFSMYTGESSLLLEKLSCDLGRTQFRLISLKEKMAQYQGQGQTYLSNLRGQYRALLEDKNSCQNQIAHLQAHMSALPRTQGLRLQQQLCPMEACLHHIESSEQDLHRQLVRWQAEGALTISRIVPPCHTPRVPRIDLRRLMPHSRSSSREHETTPRLQDLLQVSDPVGGRKLKRSSQPEHSFSSPLMQTTTKAYKGPFLPLLGNSKPLSTRPEKPANKVEGKLCQNQSTSLPMMPLCTRSK